MEKLNTVPAVPSCDSGEWAVQVRRAQNSGLINFMVGLLSKVCVCVCVCVCEVGSASAKVGRVAGQACGAWNVRVEFGFCSATVREPQQVLGLGDMLGVLEKPLCV
jgi:hypothetical protein